MDGLIMAVLLSGWWTVAGSERGLAEPGLKPAHEADRAERPADAALELLHLREHEYAGMVSIHGMAPARGRAGLVRYCVVMVISFDPEDGPAASEIRLPQT